MRSRLRVGVGEASPFGRSHRSSIDKCDRSHVPSFNNHKIRWQPTISIPQGWEYPRLTFGTRTQQGQIIGLRYYPFDSYLAYEYGEGWRYTLMSDKHSEDEAQCAEDEIVLLTPQELKAQIEAEIAKKMQEIELLTKELLAIPTNNL